MGTDESWFLWINHNLQGMGLTPFFQAITWLGDGLVLAALIVPFMVWRNHKLIRQHLPALVLSVALGGGMVAVMKIGFDRPRPPVAFAGTGELVHTPSGTASDRSFPSGHTQTAFGAAAYLSALWPLWSPLFFVLATLVGLSRVVLGVHFPMDVVVGAFVGAGMSFVGVRVNRARLERGKGGE